MFNGNCPCCASDCCGGIPVTSGTAINVGFVVTSGLCTDLNLVTLTGTVVDFGTSWIATATITVTGVLYTFTFRCDYSGSAGGNQIRLLCGAHQIAIASGYSTLTCSPLDADGTLNVSGGIICAGLCFTGARLDWHLTL